MEDCDLCLVPRYDAGFDSDFEFHPSAVHCLSDFFATWRPTGACLGCLETILQPCGKEGSSGVRSFNELHCFAPDSQCSVALQDQDAGRKGRRHRVGWDAPMSSFGERLQLGGGVEFDLSWG